MLGRPAVPQREVVHGEDALLVLLGQEFPAGGDNTLSAGWRSCSPSRGTGAFPRARAGGVPLSCCPPLFPAVPQCPPLSHCPPVSPVSPRGRGGRVPRTRRQVPLLARPRTRDGRRGQRGTGGTQGDNGDTGGHRDTGGTPGRVTGQGVRGPGRVSGLPGMTPHRQPQGGQVGKGSTDLANLLLQGMGSTGENGVRHSTKTNHLPQR